MGHLFLFTLPLTCLVLIRYQSSTVTMSDPAAAKRVVSHEEDHPASVDLDHVDRSSIKEQLAVWHANRGNRSFASAMIPRWHKAPEGEFPTTKNPFKLLSMVGPMGWALFFSGMCLATSGVTAY